MALVPLAFGDVYEDEFGNQFLRRSSGRFMPMRGRGGRGGRGRGRGGWGQGRGQGRGQSQGQGQGSEEDQGDGQPLPAWMHHQANQAMMMPMQQPMMPMMMQPMQPWQQQQQQMGDDGAGPQHFRRRWGRPMMMGRGKLAVQAVEGTRAAVLTLGDGLFLVGEMPRSAATDFGFLPLAVPAMVRTASRALRKRGGEYADNPQRRGQGKTLWQRVTSSDEELREGYTEAPSWLNEGDAQDFGFGFARF